MGGEGAGADLGAEQEGPDLAVLLGEFRGQADEIILADGRNLNTEGVTVVV